MKKIISLLITISLTSESFCQNYCGSRLDFNSMQQQDPDRYSRFTDYKNLINLNIANQNNTNQRLINNNGLITIPVVVHVLHCGENIGVGRNISVAQVQSQIDVLNEDFRRLNGNRINTPSVFQPIAADFGIEFKLACVNPQGSFTDGITRTNTGVTTYIVKENTGGIDEINTGIKVNGTGSQPWPTNTYLNIWVASIKGHNNILNTSNDAWTAYSTFPSDFNDKPQYDGVVITTNAFGRVGNSLNPYVNNLGRTTTHEIGHWLGLFHIFGNSNSSECTDDDIQDTPVQRKENENTCPSFPYISGCNTTTNPYGDMFMNYMDYTADACRNMFTNGQKAFARSAFANGFPRNLIIENSFKPIAKSTPIYCSGKIKLFNPLCLSNVTWSVVSGPATITSFNDNEAFVSSPITGNITIRASAGNYVSEQTYQVSQESPSIVGINYNNGITSGNPVMWFNPSNPIGSVNDVCIGFGFPNRFVDAVPYGSSENEVVWSVVNNTPQSGFSILQQSNNRAYFNFNFADSPTGYLQATVSGCGTYSNVVAFKQINCNPGGNPCDAALGQKFYTVSPNPASDQITIGVSNRPAPVDCNGLRALTTNKGTCFSAVNIYNNLGTLVKSFRTVSSKSATLQISNLITGNYIVEIIEGDYIEKQQLIVQ